MMAGHFSGDEQKGNNGQLNDSIITVKELWPLMKGKI